MIVEEEFDEGITDQNVYVVLRRDNGMFIACYTTKEGAEGLCSISDNLYVEKSLLVGTEKPREGKETTTQIVSEMCEKVFGWNPAYAHGFAWGFISSMFVCGDAEEIKSLDYFDAVNDFVEMVAKTQSDKVLN